MLVIALANCFGLILLFFFLAYGLIDIPKFLFQKRSVAEEQTELLHTVGSLSIVKEDLLYRLENEVKVASL